MKTLSINPFNLKPQIKKIFRRPKHVEIPTNLAPKIQDNLINLQGSLDYMATNLGLNIKIEPFVAKDSATACFVKFERGKQVMEWPIMNFDDTEYIRYRLYRAASSVFPAKPDIYSAAKQRFIKN